MTNHEALSHLFADIDEILKRHNKDMEKKAPYLLMDLVSRNKITLQSSREHETE